MKILAIDLGVRKSVWCRFETETGRHEFGVTASSSSAFRRLFEHHLADQIVVEVCQFAAGVVDLARELGMAVQVADTTQDAWCWKNVKRKTDRDDALKLARLAAIGQINPVHVPAKRVRQWRQLIQFRARLVGDRTRCKNRIRARMLPEEVSGERGKRAWSSNALKTTRAEARGFEACRPEQLWRYELNLLLDQLEHLEQLIADISLQLNRIGRADVRVRLLQTIPGVGPRAAEVIVASLDDPRRFKTRRQVAAYAGLTPRRHQSGEMDRSGRISKRGNRLLRGMLCQSAWAAVRYNLRLRQTFVRIAGVTQQRKKKAIVAVMRKILTMAWAMLRDGAAYQPVAAA